MPRRKPQRQLEKGVTLIEVALSLAVIGLLLVPVAGVINQFIFIPAQWAASVLVMNESRGVARWIAEDARQARTFTPGAAPDYGTFSWVDRTGFPVVTYTVRYTHESSTTSLKRVETIDGDGQTFVIADRIQVYEDVSIAESGGLVSVSVSSTADGLFSTMVRNAATKALMRPVLAPAHPTPPPFRLAWDNFESGNFSGGSGWLDDWVAAGDAILDTGSSPLEGIFHIRLKGSTTTATTTVERSLDLTGRSNVRIQFSAKAIGFNPGDTVRLLVDPTGAGFTAVKTWVDGDDDNVYRSEDIDLSSYQMTSEFFIAFEAFEASMASPDGRLSVDDLKIVSTWGP